MSQQLTRFNLTAWQEERVKPLFSQVYAADAAHEPGALLFQIERTTDDMPTMYAEGLFLPGPYAARVRAILREYAQEMARGGVE